MYLHKYLTLYDTCNPTLEGTVQHVLQTMHIHTLLMLNNCHHYQSVSLTSTPAGVCTPNVELWWQLNMQSIFGLQLTHYILLFNTTQCQQE